MRPIRAIPGSDEPSDRTGGTPVRTEQRNYGSALRHCESCPRQAELCPVGALASENPPAVPVPELGHCRRPHRLGARAKCGDWGPGGGDPPPAVVPPARETPARV